jgi:hypothetical protein
MKKIQNTETERKIKRVEITDDKLHGRGGLCFFLRYLERIQLLPLLEQRVGFLRKSKKGREMSAVAKQLLGYFVDGSRRGAAGYELRGIA